MMTDRPFNRLTPAEAERLAYLAEELAEAIQAVGKILRHGYENFNPDKPQDGTNRKQLERELVDVYGAIVRMMRAKDVMPRMELSEGPTKGQKYMHHQNLGE